MSPLVNLSSIPARQMWAGAGAVLAALGLAFGVQTCRLRDAQARNSELAFSKMNDSARHDTTSKLALSRKDSLRILGDSLRGVQRMVIQERIEHDALDRATRQSRVVDAQLAAIVATLARQITANQPVREDSSGTRTQTFDVDTVPYHAHADVSLPKPPGRGTMALRVSIDEARLGLRVGCGQPNADGLRPANAQVITPWWLTVRVDSVRQDPDVCNGDRAPRRSSWYRRLRYPLGAELRQDGCRAVVGGVAYPLGPIDVTAAMSWQLGRC